MTGREVLGAADVTDAELAAMVARWAGLPIAGAELEWSRAEVVPYDLEAITTAGRYWVSGRVRAADDVLPFCFFVKHVRSWSRSPQFAYVPEALRPVAAASVPWRTEALVYRSDLRDHLPAGVTMPRALAVRDLDEESAVVWLERVEAVDRVWTVEHLAHAARLLGRLAASPAVRPFAGIGEQDRSWPVRSYVEGRLAGMVVPALRDDGVWHHPLVAAAFDDELRDRMRAAANRVPRYLAEIEAMPVGAAHGDACPNNLLVTAGSDDLVLIDYGFWSTQPLGFDLSQLVVGDVQIGRRPAADLATVEAAVVPAYLAGLRDEGCDLDETRLRRAHALCLLIFSGLSALPFELLDCPPTPQRHRVTAERAVLARFSLDLVAATEPGFA